MIELPGYLEQHQRLIALFHRRHPSKRGPVQLHRLDPSGQCGPVEVRQNERTLPRVTSLAMARQTLRRTNLSPDFILKVIHASSSTSHDRTGRLIFAIPEPTPTTDDNQRTGCDEKANIRKHKNGTPARRWTSHPNNSLIGVPSSMIPTGRPWASGRRISWSMPRAW